MNHPMIDNKTNNGSRPAGKRISLIILPIEPQPSGYSRYSPLDGEWPSLGGLVSPKIRDLEDFCPCGQPLDVITHDGNDYRIEAIWVRHLWEITPFKLEQAGFDEGGLEDFCAFWDKRHPAHPFDDNPWAWFISVHPVNG
jgi:hypothetical protein